MPQQHGIVTGRGKDGSDFYQDTEVEINRDKGRFLIDDDNVGNLDYDEKYTIKFDDGKEIKIKPIRGNLSESEPCSIDFEIL